MLIVQNRAKLETMIVLIELAFIIALRKFVFYSVETSGIWEWFIFSILLFFVLPLLTIKYLFNERLTDYNFRLSFQREQFLRSLLVIFLLFAGVAAIVLRLDWSSFFSVSAWILGSKGLAVFIDLTLLPIVILSNEFFFRGFLQNSVKKSLGIYWAIIVSSVGAVLFFIILNQESDWLKILVFLGINLFLSTIAWLNRSIFVSALVNWFLVAGIDFLALSQISQLDKFSK